MFSRAVIPPAVNQIEAHAYLQQPELLKWSQQNGIVVAAYSPLGNNIYNLPRAVDDETVIALANDLNKQPAQLLISWAVQRGTVVLPKSVTASRIKDNFEGNIDGLQVACIVAYLSVLQISNCQKMSSTKLHY
jgi:L-glyceraldehyde reductase